MTRSFVKNIVRTINSSFGRYIALICIVMLGVIFYVGLKITTTDMIDTANDFYRDTNLYDYILVSSVGFDVSDLKEIRDNSHAFNIEGAYYEDVIISADENNDSVARFLSITDNVNKLVLIDGRMPNALSECVVDSRYFNSDIIGKKITLSNTNDEGVFDNLLYKEFTVTGLVDSPLYLSYQRGTTSVGNGSIKSFVYVKFDAFTIDYYTQIFVDSEDGYYIYKTEYDKYIEENKKSYEDIADQFAKKRIDAFKEEYDNSYKEYQDGVDEYESALADYEELYSIYESAVEEYEKGISEYETALGQLEEQKTQYEENFEYMSDYEQSYGKTKLEKNEELLEGTKTVLDETKETLDSNKVFLDDAKAQLDETKELLDESEEKLLEADIPTEYTSLVMTRDDNLGYSSFKDNADIVKSIAYIFPIFFVLVAALVCITTMSRMVDEERTQIGIFKALGYSKITVFSKYIIYSLSASVIGSLLGFFIGGRLFPYVIWKAYMLMYTFTSKLNIIDNYEYLIACMAVSIVILVGSTIFTVAWNISEVPASLIRPKAPEAGKRILLEKIKPIWKIIPFQHKISLRNCFRYKKRFFMMLLGIAGCTSLLIIGFGIKDSISSVCDLQYGKIEAYDYQIVLNDDISAEERITLENELDKLTAGNIDIAKFSADAKNGNIKKNATIQVCKDFTELSKYFKLISDNNIISPKSNNSCIISKNLADSLNVKIGDKISIEFDNLKICEYTIDTVFENYVNNYIYLSPEGYESGSGEKTVYNCKFAFAFEGDDVYEKLADISSVDNVITVSATRSTRDYFNDMVVSLNGIIYLVIICAAVLAFVVLYNLNNINIMERIREIATIKVLGFYKSETAAYVFRENLLLTIIGAVLGLPLGKLMHLLVMNEIKIDMICFDVHIEPLSYIISFIITIIFFVLVDLFMRSKISSIDMSESLKAIE